VATNAWIDRRRREVRSELHHCEAPVVDHAVNSGEVRAAAHEAIEHVVHSLSPLQRVVFLLCDTFDFPAKDVATLLRTTEGAVKAALHRARTSLASDGDGIRSRAHLVQSSDLDETVRRYIAAFDARDADAIAALLHEDAVAVVVGSAIEVGRDMIRANSLAEWASEPEPQRACAGVLDGREVLFVFAAQESGREALHTIIELDIAGDVVMEQRNYYFSPDLLEYAAGALGIPAANHGYQYAFSG